MNISATLEKKVAATLFFPNGSCDGYNSKRFEAGKKTVKLAACIFGKNVRKWVYK